MTLNFGDILTGGLNALFGNAGVANSVAMQQDLMRYQAKLNYKYSQKDLKTKWLANREGLEKAGYNPMLALAGVNSNSNWASQASVSDAGMGQSFGTGVSNALQAHQLEQQNNLITSQVENYNADTQLKETQAITETYEQLQKQVHADNEYIDTQLKQKDLSTYDKRWLLEQKKINQEIETMNVQNKVGLTNAAANMLGSSSAMVSAKANAYDIYSNKAAQIEQQKEYNEWAKKHPYLKSLDQTLTRYLSPASAGAGGYFAGKKALTVTNLKKPIGFR